VTVLIATEQPEKRGSMRWPRSLERRRTRLWSSDEGLTILLVLVMLFAFVVLPLDAAGRLGVWASTALDVWFAFIILAGVVSISRRRSAAILVTVLLIMGIAVHVADNWVSSTSLDGIEASLDVVLISILAMLILFQVYRAGDVTRQRIEGAIAVYLLVGLAWSQIYFLLLFFDPTALNGVSASAHRVTSRLVYFSFVTLTSTGYGDVTPVTPTAQSLANLESVAGQLYPAILLARLVSLGVSSRQARS
jgi:hypothetical protein